MVFVVGKGLALAAKWISGIGWVVGQCFGIFRAIASGVYGQ